MSNETFQNFKEEIIAIMNIFDEISKGRTDDTREAALAIIIAAFIIRNGMKGDS